MVSDGRPLPADERPIDPTPVHTADLPPTPIRDRNIPASAWVEAPEELVTLGDDIDQPVITYKREIHGWLLWRAGPARGERARYLAVERDEPRRSATFDLFADGSGDGLGPDGSHHTRFRTWKESLRDSAP